MVEAGVVDPVVVLGAERDRVGEVGASASGPGLSVVELAPGVGAFAAVGGAGGVFETFGHPLGLGEQPARCGRGRGPRTWCRGRRGGCLRCRRAGGLLRRRACWSVSRWAAFIAPVRTVWSMVTTTVAAVLGCRWSVGRCSRSSANARPRRCRQSNERSCAASPKDPLAAGSRIRRGAVIASMTLPSIAAARAGMVKCPVVVPSPLSCRVSEHFCPGGLLLGADELVLVGVHDPLVGFDGLDRPTGEPTELVGAEPGRLRHQGRFSRSGAALRSPCPATDRWRGRSPPRVLGRRDRRPGLPRWRRDRRPSSPASATCRAASARDTVVVFASQASAPVNPASFATSAESAAATSFSFKPRCAGSRGRARRPPGRARPRPAVCRHRRASGPAAACTSRHAGEHRMGAVGVEVEECCHGTILYRTNVRVKSSFEMWTTEWQPS